MADRSQWGVAIKAQTAFGTPATAPYAFLPGAQFRPGVTFNRVEDSTVAGSRLSPVGRAGTRPSAPVLTVPWRTTAFDTVMAAVFQGAYVTDTLTQGSTKTWFTLEDRQPDAAYFAIYQDLTPNSMTLRAQPNGLVEAEIQFLATKYSVSGTGTTSPTAAPSDPPFDTWTGSCTLDGSAYALSSFEITFNNRGQARYSLFSRDPDRIVFNTDQVTGQFTTKFSDASRILAAIADTTNALVMVFTSGTKGHTFTIPKIHTSNWDAQLTTDPERIETVSYEAEAVSGTKVTFIRDNT